MNKIIVFCFGRFQPPHRGTQKLFDTSANIARTKKADFRIYASHTQDKDNPLNYEEKIYFLNASFPKYKNNIIKSNLKTIFEILKELEDDGYTDAIFVVGQDRKKKFEEMIKPYVNTDHPKSLKFNSFHVVSGGDRDPDSDDYIKSISSTKLKGFADKGNFEAFKKGLSKNLNDEQVKKLYTLINNRAEVSKMKKEIKEDRHGEYCSPEQNSSDMWQSFRQWYMIQDEKSQESEKEIDEVSAKRAKELEKERKKLPDSDFLFVNKKTGERKLQVKKFGVSVPRLMGAAHSALMRGKGYKGHLKALGLSKLRVLYRKIKRKVPGERK